MEEREREREIREKQIQRKTNEPKNMEEEGTRRKKTKRDETSINTATAWVRTTEIISTMAKTHHCLTHYPDIFAGGVPNQHTALTT